MTTHKTTKHPILLSFFYTILIIIFPVAAGVIITIMQSTDLQATIIQGVLFALAFATALIINKLHFKSLAFVGLQKPAGIHAKASLYYLPLVAVEALPFVAGIQKGLSLSIVAATLMFTLFVALAEETFFRGIIVTLLKGKSLSLAIILSSVFFSLGHLSNLASGKGVALTLLQVLFAFSFGLVASIIALYTKSLLIPVLFHFVHNSFSMLTVAPNTSMDMVLGAAQCIILFGFAAFLWRKNKALTQ